VFFLLAGFRRAGIFIIVSRVSDAQQHQNPYKPHCEKVNSRQIDTNCRAFWAEQQVA
jgi:hypothetical protein